MDKFFVFQHSLTAISDLEYYPIDKIFTSRKHNELNHPLLGSPILFKLDKTGEGLNRGYLSIDEDIDTKSIKTISPMKRVLFPVAEYLFKIHHGPFNMIGETYNQIETELAEEKLHASIHPILIFPQGIPSSIDDRTYIEIWTGTDADINAEYRRSDKIMEALPRKRFNFYTW